MADHWKSIANILGAPGMEAPETSESEVEKAAEPSNLSPESEASPEADPAEPALSTEDIDAGEAEGTAAVENVPEVISAVAPKTKPAAKAEDSRVKKKKKSSWESLAGLFNITLDPQEAPEKEQASEESIEQEEDTQEKPELSIFDASESDSNPAIEAMFADAPREGTEQWNADRRVVDDVSWDEAEMPLAESDASEEEPVPRRSPEPSSSGDEDEEAPRRGRRRRRRGRRGGRSSEREATSSSASDQQPEAWGGDELNSVESSDAWSEPETFEVSDDDQQGDVERRSSRRRRGRSRGRPREEAVEGNQDEPLARAGEVDDELDTGEVESRPRRRGDRESSSRESGGRRRRRRKPADSRRDVAGPRIDDLDSDRGDQDLDGHDEEDRGEGPKHRNIPTWVDSLQAIIEANTENHRRNENRGGHRGRGRGRR